MEFQKFKGDAILVFWGSKNLQCQGLKGFSGSRILGFKGSRVSGSYCFHEFFHARLHPRNLILQAGKQTEGGTVNISIKVFGLRLMVQAQVQVQV